MKRAILGTLALLAGSAALAAGTQLAPLPQKADTAWMMLCTLLVVMMAVPGLALFYGGLVRSKNILSVLIQVLVTFCLIVVLWLVYGYSLAFTPGNAVVGGWDRLMMQGAYDAAKGSFATVSTFSKGVVIPEIVFAAFQAAFAGLSCALIVGAFAERAKFRAVLAVMVLWFTFSYIPIAHMVWFWMGPDAYTNATPAQIQTLNSQAGLLWQWGALDFAGGTVVHINAAVAGLVGAIMVGKRTGHGRENMAPHNLTLTMVGAALLWVGWFGFNAGSALEANGTAALAFINTLAATAAAVLAWCAAEALMHRRASLLGAASGAVAGLVGITPAAGLVGIGGAMVIGVLSSLAGFWAVNHFKRMLGVDDSLDVFSIHGVCGIVGALLTGFFNAPQWGGTSLIDSWVTMETLPPELYWTAHQMWLQFRAVLLTVLWSGTVSFAAYWLVDKTIGLRVSREDEREGLDISNHGEVAYQR
ncbi:MAG: ammonium transporter [Brachymonas sp.]